MPQKPTLCSVETTTWLLGGRWKASLLEHLFQGEKRFSELKRCVPGITQKTLSEQLRELRCAGIVARNVFPDAPPRVVYSVTPLGETLRPLLDAMCKWGKSHSAAMALKKLRASEQEP
jgi:DNA-binding HxlR family transcriptional regulator